MGGHDDESALANPFLDYTLNSLLSARIVVALYPLSALAVRRED